MTTRRSGTRLVSPRLIGRAGDLERLAAAVADPPVAAVVEGEAGIGKSRLVAELRTRPELAGSRFLVGSCRRIREPFPLSPVLDAVRGLGDELAGRTGPCRLSPVTGALRPLLPELAARLPPAPEPLEDRNAERHRVFRGLVELLGLPGRLVLVLEDLHWTDEHTMDFVSYLLGDPPPGLAVVLTYRREDAPAAVPALTARLPAVTARVGTVLAPLDERDTGELAAAILGLDSVPAALASRLRQRASGVPFAVEEVLALLADRGVLAGPGPGWADRVLAALDELAVPSGIRDPVLERVSRLDDQARAVVQAAAVVQSPVPPEVLAATLAVAGHRPAITSGLADAIESGLLTDRDGEIGFRHVLAAQAVYDAILQPRRQELHRRAAGALAAREPAPLGQVAHHLRHAGRPAAWVTAARRAADQAVSLGHDAEAVRLLEEPLRVAALDPGERGRLAVTLARAASATLHPTRGVVDLLWEVLGQELPTVVRGELRLWLVMVLEYAESDPHVLHRLLTDAVPDLAERPDLQAWAMACLGCPVVPGVSRPEHRRWLRRTLDVLPAVTDPEFEAFLLGKVAMARAVIGDPDWRPLTERMLQRTGGTPRRRSEVKSYHSIGQATCYAGHLERSGELLAAGLAGAIACGNQQLELRVRAAQALRDYCRGAWSGLAATARAVQAEIAGYAPSRFEVEVVAAGLSLAGGDPGDLRHELTDLVRRITRRGGFDLLAIPAEALLRLLVGQGDAAGAAAEGRRFLAAVESVGLLVSAAWALPAVTGALLAAGEPAEASGVVDRCLRGLRDLDAPLAPPAGAHANGLLASDAGQWHLAARQLRTAADGYDARYCPFPAALAREQAAQALLRAGDRVGAEDALRAAIAGYRQLGAARDIARARGVARRCGITVPAHHRGGRRGYGDSLSPREREVARFVSTGRTNQQVAAELYISPNTVKKQLAAAMRKLGVRNRAELVHLLAVNGHGGPGEDGPVGP